MQLPQASDYRRHLQHSALGVKHLISEMAGKYMLERQLCCGSPLQNENLLPIPYLLTYTLDMVAAS